MARSVLIAILGAVLLIGLRTIEAGRTNSTVNAQEKSSTMEVKIDNFSFGPAVLTVPVGSTVTWTNRDDIPHTVVSSDDQEYSNPRRWTRTTGFHSPSRGPELIRISAPLTQR